MNNVATSELQWPLECGFLKIVWNIVLSNIMKAFLSLAAAKFVTNIRPMRESFIFQVMTTTN